MKIHMLYFGRPGENLKLSREVIDAPDTVKTLADLLAWLRGRGENWAQELAEKRVRCAVNQDFCGPDAPLKDGDEVAVFSPISGG